MKYIVAVSGGVDSVVLLDKLVHDGEHELVVAHFDHGIRDDSAEDARFVAGLAEKYGVPFATKREELGAGASEELARTRRYTFLSEVAKKHDAQIATAHHMNDIAETIAINLMRGTGWRGLACLASDIYRPLLDTTKTDLVSYAHEAGLEWREDSTNESDTYLRNRVRRKLTDEDVVRQLAALRTRQVELRDEIDEELTALGLVPPYARYFFTAVQPRVAEELLRYVTEARLTLPQRQRALIAVATYAPGKVYQAGAGVKLYFTSRHFTVQMLQ